MMEIKVGEIYLIGFNSIDGDCQHTDCLVLVTNITSSDLSLRWPGPNQVSYKIIATNPKHHIIDRGMTPWPMSIFISMATAVPIKELPLYVSWPSKGVTYDRLLKGAV
jgi:hypothetical protein